MAGDFHSAAGAQRSPADATGPSRKAIWGRRALRERMAFAVAARLWPSPHAPVFLLSARPIVLYVKDWAFRPGAPVFHLLRALRRRRVDVLCALSWNHAGRRPAERLARLRWRLGRRADHRLTVLANTPAEHAHFARERVPSVIANSSALLDERVFRPLPERRVRFDAVYDARLSPFKRHELAAEVESLALVTYLFEGKVDPGCRAAVEPVVSRAHVFNGDPFTGAYRRLDGEEVNRALNQCAVGLALSRLEGAMYASAQYLLAGLPVVSTPSHGGRAEFYHPDYVRIVDATPQAVAEGVAEMRRCPVPGGEIRARTLDTMWEHRRRMFQCVDAIRASQGCERGFEEEWPALFVDKLARAERDPTAAILAEVERAHRA